MKKLLFLAFIFALSPALHATTYYVDHIGGSRYSSNQTAGLCDGTADTAPVGTTPNQHCAFNDIRYLWADGSYNASGTFPGWGWVIAGGDTVIIKDCIQYPNDHSNVPTPGSSGKCRVGNNGDGTQTNDPFLGLWGSPKAGSPSIPSGTAGAHTRILGANWNSGCTTRAAKSQVFATYAAGHVLAVSGSNYVDVACLEISDSAACGDNIGTPGTDTCSRTSPPYSDYGDDGIATNKTSTNITLTDIDIHGMASVGIHGPTGDQFNVTRVDISFNSSAGFGFDDGSGTAGTGAFNGSYLRVFWNGCTEEYPIVHAIPAEGCYDDNSAGPGPGYGDGIGTATVASSPAWHWACDHCSAFYNTQDGFDLLHVNGAGSSVTITNSVSYGNMGNQVKVGGSAPILRNSFIYGSCNALRNAITGTPAGYNTHLSDFCRAGDQAVVLSISDNYTSTEEFNTIISANTIASYWTCADTCTHPQVIYRNNVMVGYTNNTANGYPGGGNGSQPDRLYLFDGTIPQGFGIFTNSGSVYAYNSSYSEKETCPNTNETHYLCSSPTLTNQTWSITSNTNSAPTTTSNIVGNGVTVAGVPTDINSATRPNPPTIGAYEVTGTPPPPPTTPVTVTIRGVLRRVVTTP